MGTAERRLKLMKLLCCRRHETMVNLASEFRVSKRTIQRDIVEISDIIPIYVKSGKYQGGVYVMDGYYMERMYMSESELSLLCKIKRYLLDKDEINILDMLIKNYTKPSVK